jgi:hypothetical protein
MLVMERGCGSAPEYSLRGVALGAGVGRGAYRLGEPGSRPFVQLLDLVDHVASVPAIFRPATLDSIAGESLLCAPHGP